MQRTLYTAVQCTRPRKRVTLLLGGTFACDRKATHAPKSRNALAIFFITPFEIWSDTFLPSGNVGSFVGVRKNKGG